MEKNEKSTNPSNAITTSIESESFDSWTLVTDDVPKSKQSSADVIIASEASENEPSGVEEISSEDESKVHENDDLSDGISIISECESAGRLSPSQQNETNDENHNNQSYEPLTPPNTPDSLRDQSSQTAATKERISQYVQLISSAESVDIHSNRKCIEKAPASSKFLLIFGLFKSKIFLISTLIALFAFFGNLKYSNYWNESTTKLPQLFQRIEDLELQNNLLRAEIDILSKNFNSINQNREKFMKKDEKFEKIEKQKNWKNDNRGRNGFQDNKQEIKNNKEVVEENVINEFTGFSNPPPQVAAPSSQSSSGSGLPTYCKGENLWCSQEAKTEDTTSELEKEQGHETDTTAAGEKSHHHQDQRSDHEHQKQGDKEFKKWQDKDYKKKFDSREHNDSKENFENKKFEKRRDDYKKYNSKENQKKFNQKGDNSKERFDKKQRQHGKKKFDDSDHDDDDDSGEYHHHHHYEFKTDKRRDNRERNDSKEYYEKKRNFEKNGKHNKKNDSDDDDDDDHDDWHEKMMQHRENIRKNKKENDNNWYLERGSSREEARTFEKKGRDGKYKDD